MGEKLTVEQVQRAHRNLCEIDAMRRIRAQLTGCSLDSLIDLARQAASTDPIVVWLREFVKGVCDQREAAAASSLDQMGIAIPEDSPIEDMLGRKFQ